MNNSLERISPDTPQAIAFLQKLQPGVPWHLVAIKADGRVQARTFRSSEVIKAMAWIDARQNSANLYFHVNQPRDGLENRKFKKDDIACALALHVDVDDPDDKRIESFFPPPTVVISSGGGIQAFWVLEEPVTELDTVEHLNTEVARRTGGDNCQNVDRLMRLPGTVNIPNAKKRARGRVPVLAHVIEERTDWSRRYTLADFASVAQDKVASATPLLNPVIEPNDVAARGIEALPREVSAFTRDLILEGDDLDRPIGSANAHFPSRSEVVFRVGVDLAKAGCDEGTIAGVLMNPAHKISVSILEKRSPAKYALRQARRAHEIVQGGWPDVKDNGTPRSTFRNAVIALGRLGLECRYDEFHRRKSVRGRIIQEYQGDLTDDVSAVVRYAILEQFGFDPYPEHTRDAINILCLENKFHPVRDYLDRSQWDGVPRIDTWLSTYLGATDSPIVRAFGRLFLLAAVRRIRRPGTKFDPILVLEGAQGTGKSTVLKILAGEENFSDQDILTLDAKAQMENVEGVWIYEFAELDGLSRADTNKVKAFASRDADRGRPAYGRFRENRPRQTVFVGTTNDTQYLRDQTGNRRFWPVATGTIDLAAVSRDRDQLWAEAAHLEALGESIQLPEELWPAAREEQEARLEDDPWLEVLAEVKGDIIGEVVRVSSRKLLADTLGIFPEHQKQHHTKRLAVLMKKLG